MSASSPAWWNPSAPRRRRDRVATPATVDRGTRGRRRAPGVVDSSVMSVAVPPPVSAPARAGRGLQAAGVVLLVAAAVAGVVAVVAFVQRLTGAEPTSIGEGVVLQVEAGEELAIYGRSRLDSGEGCVVDGPDGAPLPSQAVRHTETLTFNDRS